LYGVIQRNEILFDESSESLDYNKIAANLTISHGNNPILNNMFAPIKTKTIKQQVNDVMYK